MTLPMAVYGAAMSSFGPHRYNPNSPFILSIAIAAVTLWPAIAIWIPDKAALVIGGIALILPTVLSICLLFVMPTAGIFGIIPTGLWYFSAAKCWKHLSL
jgi:hypothetical protein